jgi:phosphoribosylformylglycinamidine cyclo-ligase
MSKISYKDSGVDIDAGNSLVENIKPFIAKTKRKEVLGNIGSFAGAFELPTGYKNPVLLSGTDGVGTKLKLAIESKRLDSIGIDLVAMCVNDIICNWGEPLFFLDYYATGKLNIKEASDVIKGIARGCEISQCALIGGESAEMPGMYQENDFDLAGFVVGIAEKDELDRAKKIKEKDILIAFPSSGVHSNGYSLVRKLFFDTLNMKFDDKIDGEKLIDILLAPTRIYVKEFQKFKTKLNAIAHITGGGIIENLPRIFPQGLNAKIDKTKLRIPKIFNLIGKYVEENEMYRTFNMGAGLIAVVDEADVDFILNNSDGYAIGEIAKQKDIKLM